MWLQLMDPALAVVVTDCSFSFEYRKEKETAVV
jgi:hypothetical protein